MATEAAADPGLAAKIDELGIDSKAVCVNPGLRIRSVEDRSKSLKSKFQINQC